jgi:LacI family transcriptional regulator
MATIYDIAREAGVSPTTAATILRGEAKKARISDAQVKHVTLVAQNLGYRPNASARAIRSRQFGAIALLQSAHPGRSYMPGDLSEGIHDALAEHDLHLLVARQPDTRLTDEGFVPKILRQWMCDGLLIDYINDIPQRLIDLIAHYGIPSIWINAKRPEDSVYPDDFGGASLATRRLLELGHRQIAYLRFATGYTTANRHYSEIDRRDGYMSAMCMAGVEPRVIGDGEVLPRHQVRELVRQLLSSPDRPTALVTYGDDEAGQVVMAATALGLSLPGDLSLVSFSGRPMDFGGILISTMLLPEREMGRQAVGMLTRKIEAPNAPLPAKLLPLTLAEGTTIAAVAAGLDRSPGPKQGTS